MRYKRNKEKSAPRAKNGLLPSAFRQIFEEQIGALGKKSRAVLVPVPGMDELGQDFVVAVMSRNLDRPDFVHDYSVAADYANRPFQPHAS